MIRLRSLLATLALAALVTGPARADEINTAELYKKVVRSCVFIVTPTKEGVASGSGSLIDSDQRLVLTNQHVVDENEYVFVQFPIFKADGSMINDKNVYMGNIPENKALRGKVLHRDHTRDLAFVQLDPLPKGQKMPPAIPLVHKSVVSGTPTWNIGSPGRVPQLFSMTPGLVRTVGPVNMMFAGGKNVIAKAVLATNPTNPGDSGGPLFNKDGQQVAVTQSVNLVAQQVNTFIDIDEVRAYLKERKITIKELVDKDGKTIGDKPSGVGKKDSEIPVTPKDAVLKTTPVAKAAPKADATATKVEPKAVETPAAPSAADEEAAQKRLKYAQNIGSASAKRYAEILDEIISKWPGTKAAKEAEKIKATIKQ
jgi:S1-C subfamily serine protease